MWGREHLRQMPLIVHGSPFLYQLLQAPRASCARTQSWRRHLTPLGTRPAVLRSQVLLSHRRRRDRTPATPAYLGQRYAQGDPLATG